MRRVGILTAHQIVCRLSSRSDRIAVLIRTPKSAKWGRVGSSELFSPPLLLQPRLARPKGGGAFRKPHSRRQLFANADMAASRVAAYPCVCVCSKASVHSHGCPTGAAFTLKMRPTTKPSASDDLRRGPLQVRKATLANGSLARLAQNEEPGLCRSEEEDWGQVTETLKETPKKQSGECVVAGSGPSKPASSWVLGHQDTARAAKETLPAAAMFR
jgi:hypothetical protein